MDTMLKTKTTQHPEDVLFRHVKTVHNLGSVVDAMQEYADQQKLTIDQEIVLSCAFRYALGRMTYVTSSVAAELIRLEAQLPESFKARIAKEIQECQDEHGKAGMDMDNSGWNKVKWLFDKSRHVRVRAYYGGGDKFEETDAVKGDDGRYYSKGMQLFGRAEQI